MFLDADGSPHCALTALLKHESWYSSSLCGSRTSSLWYGSPSSSKTKVLQSGALNTLRASYLNTPWRTLPGKTSRWATSQDIPFLFTCSGPVRGSSHWPTRQHTSPRASYCACSALGCSWPLLRRCDSSWSGFIWRLWPCCQTDSWPGQVILYMIWCSLRDAWWKTGRWFRNGRYFVSITTIR